MQTTKERQRRLDEKANAAGVLSERQARARHAQIARNYFNSNPTIGNLYRGTVNWLQSKGIITPEGTGLITGVAPTAGRGKPTLASRRKATASLSRSGKNVQAKPSTNSKPTSKSKPSTNTSTNNKSRYVKPNTNNRGDFRAKILSPGASKRVAENIINTLGRSNNSVSSATIVDGLLGGLAFAGLNTLIGYGNASNISNRYRANSPQETEQIPPTQQPSRRSARGINATLTDALHQTVADARTRYANIPQATPQPSRNESESNTTPANSVENTGSNQRGSRRYLDSTPTISRRYNIRRGDTLSAIARRNGTTAAQLARDNGISNVNRIIAGQTLNIGRRGTGAVQPITSRPTINRADVAANTYNNVVSSIAPTVANVNVPYSPEEELLRLRGQYRRGGRVR